MPSDAKGLLTAAIRDDNPVLFLEQKLLYKTTGPVPEGEYIVPLGRAAVHRTGTDITIITYGRMLPMCLKAAEELEARYGVSAEVVDPRTLVPLDKETIIASAKKTGRVLIVHEACQTGGFGGELAAVIAESDAFYRLKAPIRRYGGLDVPIPFSPVLEARAVPDKDGVIQRAVELVRS